MAALAAARAPASLGPARDGVPLWEGATRGHLSPDAEKAHLKSEIANRMEKVEKLLANGAMAADKKIAGVEALKEEINERKTRLVQLKVERARPRPRQPAAADAPEPDAKPAPSRPAKRTPRRRAAARARAGRGDPHRETPPPPTARRSRRLSTARLCAPYRTPLAALRVRRRVPSRRSASSPTVMAPTPAHDAAMPASWSGLSAPPPSAQMSSDEMIVLLLAIALAPATTPRAAAA